MPEEIIMLLEYLKQTPVTYQEIVRWTGKDAIFKQVLLYIQHGWPHKCSNSEEWCPYFTRRNELGIVLWIKNVI